MDLIEKQLLNKKNQMKQIDEKISSEQITPTSSEKRTLQNIIRSISSQYRKELTDSTTDRHILNDKIKNTIHYEIEKLNVDYEDKKRMEKLALANIIGLGPLQQYLDDPSITEIIVQRYDNICVEREGKVYSVKAVFSDEENLMNIINRILQPVGREVNKSTPIVDAHLEDGSRICATIPPVSPKGATLTIRKFNNAMMTAQKYIELGSLSPKMLQLLRICVLGKVSIYVSGGTGTGKTTFLNMLSAFLPGDELIITIEDTLELQLKQKNVRALETRPIANGSMESVDMASLVKASLRMRPNRIIVGETRDGAIVSLLTAMSTGHEGSMSTGHANSPENLVNVRIPTMMEMDKTTTFSERAQALMIAEAIELIVQLRRLPDGRRVVSQITEISGIKNHRIILTDIFRYNHGTDKFEYTGNFPQRIADHLALSLYPIDKNFFTI